MKHGIVPAICVLCMLGLTKGRLLVASERRPEDQSHQGQLSGNSVYQLNSRWTDQDERSGTLQRFRGKPVVLAMIYTSCKDACPMIVADMQSIERAIPQQAREQVQFVLVSFDPEKDTPAQLKSFASSHGLDTKHWTLLTGSDDAVRMLAAALNVRYLKQSSGEFAHSSIITVLDSGGEIRQQQTGLRKDPEKVAAAINELVGSEK
jgi:protein SCO1